MNRIVWLLLTIFCFGLCPVNADVITGVNTNCSILSVRDFKQKTVFKHYVPYAVNITNKNKNPILLNAGTSVEFVLKDGTVIKSASRRELYRKSRKRDMGRYYSFGLPGAILAGGITGITFFIGTPIAVGVAIGTYMPTDKAVRTNVEIANKLYFENNLPVRLEPNQEYSVVFFVPKNSFPEKIRIKNLGFDDKKSYDLEIPTGEKI